ncbi:MAG: hypothetical protein LBK29_01730 [Oscillospiraceae bacterium]|jgi:hypothetical protein|nr:hypothetical protein [Oscillospiraceae bacterium]
METESKKVSESELAIINKFTKRNLNSDEVYVFEMVLCDNEVDRDYEKFSKESLKKLAELFVGKTGILDHDAKSKNQTARIFSCKTEAVPKKTNSLGETYFRLCAKAYIPRSERNKDFILSIDSGIKKEVSVRCSVMLKICSICGADIEFCEHKKGLEYKIGSKNEVCHAILEFPSDAYEWSFVAVPAQPAAGVIKSFNNFGNNCPGIFKQIKSELSENYYEELLDMFENLKEQAKAGKEYITELRHNASKLLSASEPEIEISVLNKAVESFTIEELKTVIEILRKKICNFCTPELSLDLENDSKNVKEFSQFKI